MKGNDIGIQAYAKNSKLKLLVGSKLVVSVSLQKYMRKLKRKLKVDYYIDKRPFKRKFKR